MGARLIDLTRLVSRLGRGPLTGIDRVEAVWLEHLLTDPAPVGGLVRTPAGLLFLDRGGMAGLQALVRGAAALPDRPDALSRLLRRRRPRQARAETAVRGLACARAPAPLAARMLRRQLPGGGLYLNLGHTNLDRATLALVRRAGFRSAVLVHDTIPLDHPDLVRPGTTASFARRIAAVARGADHVLFSTRDARTRAEAWFARAGRVPPALVAPLGVVPATADPAAVPAALTAALGDGAPMFLALGTIEPRKDHALLVDVWDALAARLPAADIPHLVIAGGRGWAAPALLARLDAHPLRGTRLHEAPGLTDAAVAALMDRAAALVFPSRAEGFGLPPTEAMARGCPVLCTPLESLCESLGNYPVYLAAGDVYSWAETIEQMARAFGQDGSGAPRKPATAPVPRWQDHFNTVLTLDA
ncbi:MAG: glycosyltransferase family 4 protein [Rhodobacterales bacterium]|nr:glycosyltransferase family 4 protein [Rhodobacterales bacterium]